MILLPIFLCPYYATAYSTAFGFFLAVTNNWLYALLLDASISMEDPFDVGALDGISVLEHVHQMERVD